MTQIIWAESVWDLFEELPAYQQVPILKILGILPLFPKMYPVRRSGEFAGCRFFVAGDWTVYYRYAYDNVYIRALWPARGRPR